MVCVRQDVAQAMGDFEFPDFSGECAAENDFEESRRRSVYHKR